MKPLVTIITITYNLLRANRQDAIVRCLESVHNQTYNNIEHIIIDGASNDETIEFLRPYEEKGWIKIYSELDTGIYNAFNNGIKQANGDILAFLNSDDFYHNNQGVEKSVETLIKNNVDFSYADDYVLNIHKPKKSKIRKADISQTFLKMPFCHQTMFIKKQIFEEYGNFNENYKSAGDYEFIIRIMQKDVSYKKVPLCFVTFCLGGESDTNPHLSEKECARIYLEQYSKYYPLTIRESLNIVHKRMMPINLIKQLLMNFKFYDKLNFIKFYYKECFKNFRHWFFWYNKSKKKLKILGRYR